MAGKVVFATGGPIDFTRPDSWDSVFRLIDVVAAKLVSRSGRYRDERVADAQEDRPAAARVPPLGGASPAASAFAPDADPAAPAAQETITGIMGTMAALARTGVQDTSRAAIPNDRIGSGGQRLRGSRALWIAAAVILAGLALWAFVSDGLGW